MPLVATDHEPVPLSAELDQRARKAEEKIPTRRRSQGMRGGSHKLILKLFTFVNFHSIFVKK